MENRGPILLLFSALLVLSPLAIRAVDIARKSASTDVQRVETVGSEIDTCAESTFTTSSYTLGCGATRQYQSNRRSVAGGALGISVN